MDNRNKHHQTSEFLNCILAHDVKLTKKFVAFLLNYVAFQSLKTHCQFLEWSCHGLVWLSTWLAFCWLTNNENLYEMEINMLLGLILDIFFVAILKAAFRRRRPQVDESFGPDKFSFPSGHASRSFFIAMFFTRLYPLPGIFFLPLYAWASSVSVSRILLHRHHILDVIAGVFLGLVEACLLSILWLGPKTSMNLMTWLSEDYIPGGAE